MHLMINQLLLAGNTQPKFQIQYINYRFLPIQTNTQNPILI